MEIERSAYQINLADPSHVGEVRRTALKVAERLQLSEEQAGNAALVATEMASNVVKHAKEGRIVVQKIGINGATGLQLLAIDKGPGIKDVTNALSDGWSTSDTLGGGFGAMHRMSSAFEIYTQAGAGTVVLCEIWKGAGDPGVLSEFSIGFLSTRYPGEEVNGDGWVIKNTGDLVLFVVVDGLGHGASASDASREAERIVRENPSNSPTILLEDCHKALAKTRGAAIGIAALSPCGRLLTFAGTGNVTGSISTIGVSRGLASHNGTIGHVMSRVQEFTYPWTDESLLVLHSDGVSMRWNLDSYPGLRAKSPSVVAAVLHRDFSRAHDDSTILVAKQSCGKTG